MAELEATLNTPELQGNIENNLPSLNGEVKGNSNLSSPLKAEGQSSGTLHSAGNLSARITSNPNLSPDFGGPSATSYGWVYFLYSDEKPTSNEECSLIPKDTTCYLGILNTNQEIQPLDYSLYRWIRIRGIDGERGPQGVQGLKGDSGETTLTIDNALYITGWLQPDRWVLDGSARNEAFYYLRVKVTDTQLQTDNATMQELIEYMDLRLNDKITPIVDLLVSETDVSLGRKQIEQWSYISRVYMSKETYIDENNERINDYYINFECYQKCPDIQLRYQLKVI